MMDGRRADPEALPPIFQRLEMPCNVHMAEGVDTSETITARSVAFVTLAVIPFSAVDCSCRTPVLQVYTDAVQLTSSCRRKD